MVDWLGHDLPVPTVVTFGVPFHNPDVFQCRPPIRRILTCSCAHTCSRACVCLARRTRYQTPDKTS